MDWLFKNSEESFRIDIAAFLSNRKLTAATIVEAEYLVKRSRTDLDSDAIVSLTLNDGIEVIDNELGVKFRSTDFTALTVGSYKVGLKIRTSTITEPIEAELIGTDGRKDDGLVIVSSFFVP